MPAKKLEKETKEYLSPKSFIAREVEAETRQKELRVENQESEITDRRQLAARQETLYKILTYAFPVSVVFTLSVVLLDGYQLGGLEIDTSTINLLIAATIAEIAGLLTVIVTSHRKNKGD